MIEFTLRRLMATIPVLLGILLVAFTVLYLIPGDPALTVAGPRADETTLNRIRAEMGLDLPVHTRFVNYLLKICKGDFGESVISGKPVLSSLTEKLPVTLKLALISILFSTLIGVLCGRHRRSNKRKNHRQTVHAFFCFGNKYSGLFIRIGFFVCFRR